MVRRGGEPSVVGGRWEKASARQLIEEATGEANDSSVATA